MQQKEKPSPGESSSPENKEHSKPEAPLSESIPNANASGDGAMRRDKDTILEQDQENRENRRDDGIEKDPEPY
jgi:hypothetical protein